MADVKKVVELEIDVDTGEVKKLGREVKTVGKSLKSAKKGTMGLASGFKKVGTALKATGIGLLIAALAKLAMLFGENQQVMDKFDTATTGLGIAFNDFFSFISDNIGTVIDFFKDLFENPQENLKKFGDLIKENLMERFNSLLEVFGYLGTAIKKLFEGDWQGAMDAAGAAGKEMVDVYTGVDGSFNKIVDTVSDTVDAIKDYTTSTWEQAEAIVEVRKQMQFSEVESRKLQLAYQLQAEGLRQIRDDETKSFEERIVANKELGKVLEESAEAEKAEIQRRIDAAANENALLGETQERLLAIETLKVEQLDIDERIAGFRSEQLMNENSLLREQAQIREDAEAEALAKAEALAEEEIALAAKASAAAKAAADEEIAFAQKVKEAKIDLAKKSINTIITLNELFVAKTEAGAKLQFRITKALRLSEAVITGVNATINAFNSATANVPATALSLGAYPFIQAAAAGVFAAGNIATIAATQFNGGGGGGGMATASRSAPSTTSAIPSFDTIGSSGTNQLSEAIAGQNNQPMRAYVVANDVNSAQSLERNRQSNATFP